MPTKSDVIKDVYTTYYGTKAQTLAHIKDDPDYTEYGVTKKDVDEWFATIYLTEGSKKQRKANSNHSLQLDHPT